MTQRPRKSNDWDVLDRDWGVIPKNPTLQMQQQATERMNADLEAWQEKWAEMNFIETNLLSIKRGSILVGVDMWRDRLEKGFKVKNLRSPHSIYAEYFPSVANRPEAVETYRNAYLLWKATGQMGDDIPESITATNPEDALQEIIDHLKEKEAYDERLTLNKDLAIAMKAQSDLRLAKYKANREKAAAARATAANENKNDEEDGDEEQEEVPPPWKEAFDEICQLGGKATALTPANESDLASKVIEFLGDFPDEAGSIDRIWSKFNPRVKMPIRNQLFRSVPITLAMNKYFGLIEMFELSKYFEAQGREVVEKDLEKYYNRFGQDVVGQVESAFENGIPAILEYLKGFGRSILDGDENLASALRASSIEPDLPPGDDLVVDVGDVLLLPPGKDGRSFKAAGKDGKYVKFVGGWKRSENSKWVAIENLDVIEKLESYLSLMTVQEAPEVPNRPDLVIRDDDGLDIGVSGGEVSIGTTTRSMAARARRAAAEDEELDTVEI